MSVSSGNDTPIGNGTAAGTQELVVKRVEFRGLVKGFTGDGNHPEGTVKIEVTGMPNAGTVTRVVLMFFPVADNRLTEPSFNPDTTVLTVTQLLEALPGWIAALTDIPINEETVITYIPPHEGRYEVECLRVLTNN